MTDRIQSVDRAIDLLLAVAGAGPGGAGVPALARSCGLNRATAWRLLKTLEARGMVVADDVDRYRLGQTTAELGHAAGHDALVAVAHPVLERMCARTGVTASLARHGVGGLIYIDEVTPPTVLAASWLGHTAALHATSAGKALLAFLPADEVARVLPPTLPALTDSTTTSRDALAAELTAIRARGYGSCAGEQEAGLNGVSAPVLDRSGRPLAVLSIWGPEDRLPASASARLGPDVADAAREIEGLLGAGGPTPDEAPKVLP